MTTIKPVNVALISQAIVDAFKQSVELAQVTTVRGEDTEMTPDICPWIGVYRLSVEYPQRLLSGHAGFRGQQVRMLVLVSQADQGSGEACEDALEELVQNVLGALMTDTTLGGVVSGLDGFAVDYTRYTREGQSYLQTAAIQFVALTNTIIGG